MSKVCKECGQQMDDNVQACPNCGCPVQVKRVASQMEKVFLSQGKGTEAESIVAKLAKSILRWGNFWAILALFISSVLGITIAVETRMTEPLFIVVYGVLIFIVIRFIAKVTWAVITLFVNISTTLKRIEKLLETNGTDNM